MTDFSPAPTIEHLRRANQGHHPFGAILVVSDGIAVLLEQGNVDTVNHAESLHQGVWQQLT
ncbi:MAG: hypothetical protein WBA99_04435 [Nodosilinea sp.]